MVTGKDLSANAFFGSLQRITAEKLGLDPVLMAAANTTGGVAGKLIAFQSIVVATTATKNTGNEVQILRYIVWHSAALVTIIGMIVMIFQCVFPQWVPHNLQFLGEAKGADADRMAHGDGVDGRCRQDWRR